jgi:hypothetical protein
MKFDVVLIVGPCRSGTTFVFNALSSSTHTGIFQPIKHSIRSEIAGEPKKLDLRDFSGQKVIIKEAFGPYDLREATFDPVAAIYKAIKPATPLLITVLRTPDRCYASWKRSFCSPSAEPDISVFNAAYNNSLRLREEYQGKLPTIDLLLDDEVSFPATLSRIKGMLGSQIALTNYKTLIKVRDPDRFEVSGLLSKAMSGRDYIPNHAQTKGHITLPPELDLTIANKAYETIKLSARSEISHA